MRTLSVFALLCLAGCESATLEVGEPGQTLTDPTTVPGTLPTLPCLAAVDSVSPDPGGLPRYPIKAALLVGFALLALQGVSEAIRRLAMLRGDLPVEAEPEQAGREHEGWPEGAA